MVPRGEIAVGECHPVVQMHSDATRDHHILVEGQNALDREGWTSVRTSFPRGNGRSPEGAEIEGPVWYGREVVELAYTW